MNFLKSTTSILAKVAAMFVALALMSISAMAFSPQTDLTAQQTFEQFSQGNLVLIDIRTEPEWRQTGVAKDAKVLSMTDPQFLNQFAEIQAANPGKPVAFICASSNRSGQVQAALAQRGFTNVYSVFGGMTGNGEVAGWIADGLPVTAWPVN